MGRLPKAQIRKALRDHKVLLYRFRSTKETTLVAWYLDCRCEVRKNTIRIPENRKDTYYDFFGWCGHTLTRVSYEIEMYQYTYELVTDESELGKIEIAFLKTCILCAGIARDVQNLNNLTSPYYNKPLAAASLRCAMIHFINGDDDKCVKLMVELENDQDNMYQWAHYRLYKGE